MGRHEAELASVGGPAVFAEWLAAHGEVTADAGPARLAQVAAFARLDPALGWQRNLRRRRGRRVAVQRGAAVWTYAALSASDAAFRTAAGTRADGHFDELVRAVADHLLCADTRPDDTLTWRGDPEDPWPWGMLVIGGTLVLAP